MLLKLQVIHNSKFASKALHNTVCVMQDYTMGLPYAAVKKQNTSTLTAFQSFCINLQGKQKQSTSKGQATLLCFCSELPFPQLYSLLRIIRQSTESPNHVLFHSSNTILNMYKKPAVIPLKSSMMQLVISKGRELVQRT